MTAYIRTTMEGKRPVKWELMLEGGVKVCDLTKNQLLELAAQAVVSVKEAA